MQTVHIESLCVYPSIRDFMVVGFIWASRRCHILDSEIVRDFQVDLVWAVKAALRTEKAGGFIDTIVGVSEESVIGSMTTHHKGELSLFVFLRFSEVVDRSAVAGTMIYIPLIRFPVRVQEDGEVMEHIQPRYMVVCPLKSN
jgi:hypothetical protein